MAMVLILGDVHLGKSTTIGKAGVGSALNSRIIDQLNLMDWTIDQAIEHNAYNIIVTGDVFEDPKPHPSLITMLIAWVNKCSAYGIHVHIIHGNHDILRSGTYYTSPLDILTESDLENCTIYKNIDTIYIDDVAFTLLPFRDRKSFICESNAEALVILQNMLVYELTGIPIPFKKVLVGHLAIEGSIPVGDEIDDLINEIFCPVSMFAGYDYVWMGHVHKPQVMQKSPLVAHIGSMDISNFGETDHKKHIVLFDTSNDSYEKVEIPTRSLKKISIVVPKDTKDTTKYVINELKTKYPDLDKAIVKLEVSLASQELLSMNRGEVEKFIYGLGAYNLSTLSESKKIAILKKDGVSAIDSTMDVPTAIKLYSESNIDADKRDLFLELALDILKEYKSEVTE